MFTSPLKPPLTSGRLSRFPNHPPGLLTSHVANDWSQGMPPTATATLAHPRRRQLHMPEPVRLRRAQRYRRGLAITRRATSERQDGTPVNYAGWMGSIPSRSTMRGLAGLSQQDRCTPRRRPRPSTGKRTHGEYNLVAPPWQIFPAQPPPRLNATAGQSRPGTHFTI